MTIKTSVNKLSHKPVASVPKSRNKRDITASDTPSTSRKAPSAARNKPSVTTSSKARNPTANCPAKAVVADPVASSPSNHTALPIPSDPFRESKQAYLIALLRNPAGATIDQMTTLTGWQAHSVRGVISGVLRKKLGLNVVCERLSDSSERRYHIVGSAS